MLSLFKKTNRLYLDKQRTSLPKANWNLEQLWNNVAVQTEWTREVRRLIEYYNLDVIISVGYGVNTEALDLLDGYIQLSYEECIEFIISLKFDFSSDMFGTEKTEWAFEGILGSIYQSVFVKDIIPMSIQIEWCSTSTIEHPAFWLN